ncbi:hypothetical protein DPU05_14660 [Salmonella enterica subsp. enterica serovar Teddington]|nr:hypothetical protein [Salmonella enterica subsp. enterica serovar Coquilhatville]EBW5579098.1 hypothetical protein [Salmonella enterica subsp. enterica serovar Teddington]ECE5860668.1 hypothetical protein [Salmonella enterica subsp. enterica]
MLLEFLKKYFRKISKKNFCENGYILLASPDDLVELIGHPSAIPPTVLRKLVVTAIQRLDAEAAKNQQY